MLWTYCLTHGRMRDELRNPIPGVNASPLFTAVNPSSPSSLLLGSPVPRLHPCKHSARKADGWHYGCSGGARDKIRDRCGPFIPFHGMVSLPAPTGTGPSFLVRLLHLHVLASRELSGSLCRSPAHVRSSCWREVTLPASPYFLVGCTGKVH